MASFFGISGDLNYLALIMLIYGANVSIETGMIAFGDPVNKLLAPPIAQGLIGTILSLFSLPTFIWAVAYALVCKGLWMGFLAWVGFQIIGALFVVILRVRKLIAIHILAAFPALACGWYWSISSLH